jgi:hypothetical protein
MFNPLIHIDVFWRLFAPPPPRFEVSNRENMPYLAPETLLFVCKMLLKMSTFPIVIFAILRRPRCNGNRILFLDWACCYWVYSPPKFHQYWNIVRSFMAVWTRNRRLFNENGQFLIYAHAVKGKIDIFAIIIVPKRTLFSFGCQIYRRFRLLNITLSVSFYIWNHVVYLLSLRFNTNIIMNNSRGCSFYNHQRFAEHIDFITIIIASWILMGL